MLVDRGYGDGTYGSGTYGLEEVADPVAIPAGAFDNRPAPSRPTILRRSPRGVTVSIGNLLVRRETLPGPRRARATRPPAFVLPPPDPRVAIPRATVILQPDEDIVDLVAAGAI